MEMAKRQSERVRRLSLGKSMVVPDEVLRSNRKTLSICVDGLGRLIVRAPLRCGEARIAAFLREKEAWILRQQAKQRAAGLALPPDDLDGYALLLLGEYRTICLTDGKHVTLSDGVLYIPRNGARERLVRWLKAQAKRIFTELTAQTAQRMGVAYASVSVNGARGHWGSCSGNNAIHYSFRLLYAPKAEIEYVVVHELAHTVHKNHSAAFWETVEKYVPDWRMRRAWLKAHSGLTAIF